jgi:hypothetical protein
MRVFYVNETSFTPPSLLFDIAFLPVIMITIHLTFLLCNRAHLTELNGFVPQGSAKAALSFSGVGCSIPEPVSVEHGQH